MPLPILPRWTSFMPGSMSSIYNMIANARNAAATRASTSQQPRFDPATLENALQPAGNSGRPGVVPGGIDITGDSPQSSFLDNFLQTRSNYVAANQPTTQIPYGPGSYPLPGGGNMANAAGDWFQNAMRSRTPFTMLTSPERGVFGTQTTTQLPDWLTGGTGAGVAALGGGGWRRFLN